MKRVNYLITVVVMLGTLLSCSKERAEVGESTNRQILFYATYLEGLETRGSTTFLEGNRAQIFAYTSNESPTLGSFVDGTPLFATAKTGGELQTDAPLYLPKGAYDFYSLSLNSSEEPALNFESGTSTPLENGIDYLWAKSELDEAGSVVSFAFSHSATKVEIEILKGEGIDNLEVNTIRLTPSLVSSATTMELSSGVIVAAQNTASLLSLTPTNNSVSYIMVPLEQSAIDIEISASLTIGQVEVENKEYSAQLPSSSYDAGKLYKIKLIVKANALEFLGSTVEEWNVQEAIEVPLVEV